MKVLTLKTRRKIDEREHQTSSVVFPQNNRCVVTKIEYLSLKRSKLLTCDAGHSCKFSADLSLINHH